MTAIREHQTHQAAQGTRPRRAFSLAALVSFFLHLVLLLLLSLIVIGGGTNSTLHELVISETEADFALEDIPAFDLTPELPETVEVPPTELTPEIDLPDLEAPTFEVAQPEPEVVEESQAELGEGPSENTESMVGLPVAKAVTRIQERVSQAGGRKGEVQFALAWRNVNDVDLHVIAPSGERIWHLHKRSQDAGMLDVDMNVRGESTEPVENVRWISNAPWGRYTVLVNLFQVHRGARATSRKSDFQLLVHLGKDSIIEEDFVSTRDEQVAVFRYFYVPNNLPPMQRERVLAELESLQREEESQAEGILENAKTIRSQRQRDVALNSLVIRFPHTDAAIKAMRLIGGSISKR